MYDPKRLHMLQLVDEKIDQLTRERNNQPEKNELIEITEKINKLKILKDGHDGQYAQAGRDQKRIENDLSMVEEKTKKNEARLYNGNVTNPKELKSIQDEVGHLKNNVSELEDELLEAIDKTDKLADENRKLSDGLLSFEKKKNELSDAVMALNKDKDELIENLKVERETVSKDIDDEVMKLYERLRKEKDGVAVAVLKDGTCQGCHVSLPESELNAFKDDTEIWRCGHCSRIVVKEIA